MTEKNVKSRIQVKRDNTDNWNTAGEKGFTPKEGEIIFYSDVNKLKVGDGKTAVHLLSFIQVDADEIGEHEHSNYYTEDEVDAIVAELVANQQIKLKAGNGISIAEDGTISVTFAAYAGAFEGNGELI